MKRLTNEFGDYIRNRRVELGLTQQEVAPPLWITLFFQDAGKSSFTEGRHFGK